MRVIFVNRFALPDHSATSQMLSDLAIGLAERGYQPVIIASRLRYTDPDALLPTRETLHGIDVRRVWTSRFGRHVLIGRAIDYLTFYLSASWALLMLAGRNDTVVVKTDPPLLSVPLSVVCRLKGARLVNWLQDLYPEVVDALGVAQSRLAQPVLQILRWLRNRSLRAAIMNVAIGELMAAKLRSEGVPSERISVIQNWADGRIVRPVPRAQNPLSAAWGLDGTFIVGYSGNLGRAHDAITFADAIELIERGTTSGTTGSGRPIRWLFIGGGAQLEALRTEVEKRQLRSVQFRPYQPREQLSESLSLADIHLISLRPELEGLIVPSKLYGILAAGRPAIFVGSSAGEVPRILASIGAGSSVATGDGAALAQAIIAARDAQSGAGSDADQQRIRQRFEADYELHHAIDAWDRLLRA